MHGQPCMVLQTRYFCLLDFTSKLGPKRDGTDEPTAPICIDDISSGDLSIDDIVAEVSAQAYHAGKASAAAPEAFVCAHEVVFDSKGKRTCNMSM